MECGWYAYQSKSGETLFFFNKITGQYKWLSCSCSKNLEPWIPDANSFKGVASEVIEYDKPDNMTSVHVRSISTETDLPAAQKTLNTQGTQTECLDGISRTDDTLSQNVLSTIMLNNSNHQKVPLGDNSKPVLPRNSFLLQDSNSNCNCSGKENCNGWTSTESKQTYKVKLFECSYCEKAFTSYAFLVKHEKYHVENDSQKKVCDGLDETRSVNSISVDPEVEQEETKKNYHLMKDVTKQTTVVSTLINTPPSNQADSIPFFQACFQCGKSFTMSDEFDSHLHEHLKERYCNPCQKSFKDTNQFIRHICSYHVTLRQNCHLCKGKYLFKSSLTNHLWHFHKIASNDKEERGTASYSQKCGSCEASFKLSDKLMEHQRAMKHKGIRYQCHGCGKLYAVLIDLQQHLIQEHNLNSQSTSSSLSSMNSHKKPLQHKESLIKKRDSSDSVQPDRDAQRYWCNECNVSYTWSCDLVKHKIKKKCFLDRPIVQMIGNSQHYICSYCDRPFDNLEQFGKHYIKHFGKNTPINCDRCTQTFSTFQSLENHLVVHLGVNIKEANIKGCLKPYSCDECGKTFGTVRNLRRHIKRNHAKEKQSMAMVKFCCDICNKVYSHRSTLSTHKKTHLVQNNSLPQRAAQTRQVTEPVLTKLKKPAEITGNKNGTLRKFKCDRCQRTFFNAECLSRHKTLLNHGKMLHLRSSRVANTVEEPKSRPRNIYYCQVCKKSFKYYNMFYKHRSAHKVEKTRGCTICGKFFKVDALSSHKCLSCKKAPPKITKDFFSCNICGKVFLESRSLKGHMQAHSKGHFDCMSCSIAFSSAERLNKHMRNHKNEVRKLKNLKLKFNGKLHECNICQKFYSCRKNLVRHRKHICIKKENSQSGGSAVNIAVKKTSVDKNYQNYDCEKCQKSFVLFSEYYSHCSEHGEEKPCCKCDKLLSSSSSLKRHLTEIHTRDHTFYCHMCSEEFYSMNGLINHTTLVPGAKRHKCNVCGQAFALCNGLMDHVKTHTQ